MTVAGTGHECAPAVFVRLASSRVGKCCQLDAVVGGNRAVLLFSVVVDLVALDGLGDVAVNELREGDPCNPCSGSRMRERPGPIRRR
jgi:hypothetical protein